MKNIFSLLLALLILASCANDSKGSMLVTGTVKGLKKGTLYLQKMNDTILVSVDSLVLDGVENFSLSDELESPEIYYLTLGNDKEKQIPFFGDKGTITINTKLDKFKFGATVEGLKNHELLEQYNDMKSQYTNKNLDLIKAEFDAQKNKDSLVLDSVQTKMVNLEKSKHRYTANFAITNGSSEVSPYVALTELYNANIVWLDSISNSLTEEVKVSKYGKQLDKFITEIKSKE